MMIAVKDNRQIGDRDRWKSTTRRRKRVVQSEPDSFHRGVSGS
jgi:hypothetical protein